MYNLFIFHRDLRCDDNIGLLETCKKYKKNVVPVFIFTNEQIDKSKNKFFSNNAVQFMCDSLSDLSLQLKNKSSNKNVNLVCFEGEYHSVLKKIMSETKVNSISFNIDYTPYAKKRTKKTIALCKKNKIHCDTYEDYLLAPIGTFNKEENSPYKVYSPFKNNVYKLHSNHIPKPEMFSKSLGKSLSLFSNNERQMLKSILSLDHSKYFVENKNIIYQGGRTIGLKSLSKFKKSGLSKYDSTRNTLSKSTSELSAYIKFGCLSPREIFYIQSGHSSFKDQLIWREFYFYIAHYFPKVLSKRRNALRDKMDKIKWKHNKKYLELWKQGKTGFPIVDAAMRQMNETGYMHNRGRLITSNFLNRILGLDWRHGEKYFAQTLVDYDPCVNNGNWQWIASVGVDTKPSKQRIFNPALQSMKYDREAEYIKRWIPELKFVSSKDIHNWTETFSKHKDIEYEHPIVDYKTQRDKSIELYKKYE